MIVLGCSLARRSLGRKTEAAGRHGSSQENSRCRQAGRRRGGLVTPDCPRLWKPEEKKNRSSKNNTDGCRMEDARTDSQGPTEQRRHAPRQEDDMHTQVKTGSLLAKQATNGDGDDDNGAQKSRVRTLLPLSRCD